MFAVIFTANPGIQDQEYLDTAQKMRQLALTEYGCLNFISASSDEQEVGISYWPDAQSILRWKNDTQHLEAQTEGKKRWYSGYKVEVVEIKRSYKFGNFK